MKAVISYAEGDEHLKIAEMTWPIMQAYANAIGASWVPYTQVPKIERPPAWKKLVCLAHALATYDEVLWLDADVVVADHESIFDCVPADKLHALVEHHTDEGDVPNTGVWVCRREMLPWLMTASMRDECIGHKWWEQAAILHLLGYVVKNGICGGSLPTALLEKTHWLDERWNFCHHSKCESFSFLHPCGAVGEARIECIKKLVGKQE